MSEPCMRRTQSGQLEKIFRPLSSPLAKALSLCGVLSVFAFSPTAAMAESEAAETVALYSIESAKARSGLLTDVALAGTRLVAVGERGHILYSDDNGGQWSQAKVPTRNLLTAVYFVDSQHGWAVGHDALILATADAGQTWTEQFRDVEREEGAPFVDVWFQNKDHGLVIGAYGALLETTDGGENWEDVSERIDNEDGFHLNAIAEVKGAGLFVVGEMGSMFRSADAGSTWEKVDSPYEGSLFGVMGTHEANSLLVFGLRGNMFRSADFGSNWQPVKINTARGSFEIGLASGALTGTDSISVVGHGGAVLTSKDDGRSFDAINRPDRQSLSGVAADGKGNLILVGQGGARIASPTGTALGQQ